MVIPYDQLLGVNSLTAILTEATKYKTNRDASKFVWPSHLPFYNRNIANNATIVVHVCAKATHKSHLDNYPSYKAVKCGVINSSATLLMRFGTRILHKGHGP
jgi:hypothetical protein